MPADGSLLSMTSALGADALEPVALKASEAINAPFLFTVDVTSSTQGIDADKLLYQPACVTLSLPYSDSLGETSVRYFHGMVRSFHSVGAGGLSGWVYRLELVPKLWFLGQTHDCRVFQQKSVVDILKAVLNDNGITEVTWNVSAGQPRPYSVQYNETDLAFITRLMQEEGYSYFFEHSDSQHTLVICEANTAFADVTGPTMNVAQTGGAVDVITGWSRVRQTVAGAVAVQDYDPINPSTEVKGSTSTLLKAAGAPKRDWFHWPALTTQTDVAKADARRRQEAAEAEAELYSGEGRNPGFLPGYKFTVENDPLNPSGDKSFAIRAVEHEAVDEAKTAGGAVSVYRNSFTCWPSAIPLRPERTVNRPHMAGIFAAIVLGTDGEEIFTDEYGRIKVRLMWDWREETTANDTIWVRVMQPWSGNGWGWQHIPRVGTEVAVVFVDGDPDHPLVIGSMYTGEWKSAFAMPDEKTKTGIRTRSTLKGGTADYSEFSFDDKKGEELVFLHAQKDLKVEVETDNTIHIQHDQNLTIDNCRVKTIKADETVQIQGKQSVTVTKSRTTEITESDETLTVKGGNITVTVNTGNISESADAGNISQTAGQSIKLKANTSIELTCGTSSIKLDPTGITLSAMQVKIDGQMMLDLKSGLMTQIAGSMVNVKGDGMLMLKGGIMMLN
jgi:type VI secretion system secreted protein VgrG